MNPRFRELKDLAGLVALLQWDQETTLPAKAADARGHQLGVVQSAYHARLVDPALGDLLAREPDAALARVVGRERDRALKVPERLVRALAVAQAKGVVAWKQARADQNFAQFEPALAELIALRREQADAIGHGGQRYDALLAGYEPGMTTARLMPVLRRLEAALVPMVAAQKDRQPPDLLAGRTFPRQAQGRVARRLLEIIGFDFEAGVLDLSVHPFSVAVDVRDVRLTTRLDEAQLWPAVFATLHEGGHGLYAQGFAPELHGTPLANVPSMGLDESQSRLFENQVGRSRPFWQRHFPMLQQHFGAALDGVDAEGFYRSVNRVVPSLVRGGSDEVTYNLHIVLRTELELLLIDGRLPLEDLPAEWNRRMQALLGVTVPHDTVGVLQDIHWAQGDFGYFPTYTLGNLYAASLFAAMQKAPDDLPGICAWLGEHVWAHGARYDAEDLITRICGHGLRDDDFLAHLKAKFAGG